MRKNIISYSLLVSLLAVLLPSVSFAANNATFTGTATTNKYGKAVATGDFNGDGYQDMVVGSPVGSYITVTYGGAGELSSLTVSSSNTVVITGASSTDNFGVSLASGDVNNDGYDDILVGASTSGGSTTGAAYLIYGKATQLTSLAVESDTANIKFTGSAENLGNATGLAIADINGDGFDDMMIGAKNNTVAGSTAGAFYVLYGKSDVFTSSTVTSASTSRITAEAAANTLGNTMAAGDLNGDGYAEIVVGAPGNNDGGNTAGAVYIIYGSSSSLTSGTSSISSISSISTVAEITGEAIADNAGNGGLVISKNSIDGDTYNDLLIGATGSDDGASNGGATYFVPGSAIAYTGTTSLGSTSFTEFTNTTASTAMPSSLTTSDLNQDGYDDMVIGASAINSSEGTVYVIPGATSLSGVTIAAADTLDGENASDAFGISVGAGDLNADGFPELLIGANGYSAGANSGAMYIVYPYIDADLDGLPGTDGLFSAISATAFNASVVTDCSDTDAAISADQTYYQDSDGDGVGSTTTTLSCTSTPPAGYASTSTDCSDTDATVSEDQTYYTDADGDGLGTTPTTTSCTSTAPAGYADNDDDTNDAIDTNGVEIGGDGVDNDGDSVIDEVNTTTENGDHPEFGDDDASASAATTIVSVSGTAAGAIEVTYADDSVYSYTVYTSTATKDTNVVQYQTTGYGIVMHNKGKKVYLVNLFTGEVVDKVTIKKAGFDDSAFIMKDLRSNNKDEVIVTGKTRAKVTLAIVKVNKSTGALTKSDSEKITNKNVSVNKTKATAKKIKLQSSKSKTLETFKVTKKYKLKLI